MSSRGRTTRKAATASPAATKVKPEIEADEVTMKSEEDSAEVMDESLEQEAEEHDEKLGDEAEQDDNFVSFNVNEDEEEHLKNGGEHEKDEGEEETEQMDTEQADDKPADDEAQDKTKEDGDEAKEDAKDEKPSAPALPKRENYTVAAYFKMHELSDLSVLQPFLDNCDGIHVNIQGSSGKEKVMIAQIVYKTALYKTDIAAIRALKLRDEPLDDLKVRGEPVEPPARVYVSNIPEDTIEDLLQMLFPKATKITIPKTADGKSKGCAMLTLPCMEDAEQCVKENAGMKIENNELAMKVMRGGAVGGGDRPIQTKRSVVTDNTAASKRPKVASKLSCFQCGKPGHFARECHSNTDIRGRLTGGMRQRSLMSTPITPVAAIQQPNQEVMAQHMANNMAVKMQQMQERMTAVMTEKIMSQVSSQLASQQMSAPSNTGRSNQMGSLMSGGISRSAGAWSGNQGQQQSSGLSRTAAKKRMRAQRMREQMGDGGDQRSNYQSYDQMGGAGTAGSGYGDFQSRYGSGTSSQYSSLMGSSGMGGRSGYY